MANPTTLQSAHEDLHPMLEYRQKFGLPTAGVWLAALWEVEGIGGMRAAAGHQLGIHSKRHALPRLILHGEVSADHIKCAKETRDVLYDMDPFLLSGTERTICS